MIAQVKVVNIHEAKTHLSRLTEEAARGEPFIIAKAGRPLVKVVPLDPSPRRSQVPAGSSTLDAEEIQRLFHALPMTPVARDIRSLKGIVPHMGRPVSIEDMNDAISRMGRT